VGWSSILDPADKIPQDENKPRAHTAIAYSCVILVTTLLLDILDKTLRCLVKIQHIDVLGVSFPEEEGLEQLPDLLVAPGGTGNAYIWGFLFIFTMYDTV